MKNQRILLLDNYDSFTYNLVHYIEELTGQRCEIVRNDAFEIKDLENYDALIISPGPGLPEESGCLIAVIKTAMELRMKVLGVCLGMQAMAVAAGGSLKQLDHVMHGLQRNCTITIENDLLLAGIPRIFSAGRYHSWIVDAYTLPAEYIVTSVDEDNNIMSISHRSHAMFGVQFHPESIMTLMGKKIMENWLLI